MCHQRVRSFIIISLRLSVIVSTMAVLIFANSEGGIEGLTNQSGLNLDENRSVFDNVDVDGEIAENKSGFIWEESKREAVVGNNDIKYWQTLTETLCPSYRSCGLDSGHKTSTNVSLQQSGQCCQKCECSDSCRTPNCCNDKPRDNKTLAKCLSVFDIFNKTHPNNNGDVPHYFVIDFCDETSIDIDNINGRHSPTSISLQDIVFVTDIENKHIYKNGKIAQCNNVKNYTYWDLVAIIDVDVLYLDLMEVTERVSSEQQVLFYSRPTDSLSGHHGFVETNSCSPNAISTCNKTEQWDVYDEELDHRCRDGGSTMYYGKFYYFDIFYANVYCYMCNQKRASVHEEVESCRYIREQKSFQQDIYLVPELKMVLNVNEVLAALVPRNNDTVCNVSSVFDPFLKQCRRLYCPLGSFAIHGTCRDNVTQTEGLPIKFTIAFSKQVSAKYTGSGREYFKNLYDETVKAFGLEFHDTDCFVCGRWFYYHNVTSRVYVDMAILSSQTCTTVEIITTLTRVMEYGSKAFTVSNIRRKVRAKMAFNMKAAYGIPLYYKFGVKSCRNGHDVYLHEKFHCPFIQITDKDVLAIKRFYGEKVAGTIIGLADVVKDEGVGGTNGTNSRPVETLNVCGSDYWSVLTERSYISRGMVILPDWTTVVLFILVVLLKTPFLSM